MDPTERFEAGSELVERVRSLHDSGYRLVQIGCLEVAGPVAESPAARQAGGGGEEGGAPAATSGQAREPEKRLELIYSFDKSYELIHLRMSVAPGDHVPSISAIYDMAFLYENEIHDLFGLVVDGISLDFKGTFYQKQAARPFCSTNGVGSNAE